MISPWDIPNIEKAIELANQSPLEKPNKPKVGAVLATERIYIAGAFRSEIKEGDHAEHTLLDEKLKDDYKTIKDATLYTTLEPCTVRGPGERPCAERIVARNIGRVVIGILDPNQDICGRGVRWLRKAGIEVDLFPREYMEQVEDQNREFIRYQERRTVLASATPVVGLTLEKVELEPAPKWHYKFKLRLYWVNDGDQIHMGKPNWVPGGVGIQGAVLGYKYQIGGGTRWEGETEEADVLPNQHCRVYIGLDPEEKNINLAQELLRHGRLGTLSIPVTPKHRKMVELRVRPKSSVFDPSR
jgi:pyrimidine deaminase RibD-like protein